jgi:uncharacterized protein (TIGR02421 family)
MSLDIYRNTLRSLSDELIALQKPIRILDSIKWPQGVKATFLADQSGGLPVLPQDYYASVGLKYDAERLVRDLVDLRRRIRKGLGRTDALGQILSESVGQYEKVIAMLQARGTPGFADYSKQLYGSAFDHLRGDRRTLNELGQQLCSIFTLPAASHMHHEYPANFSAQEAVSHLSQALEGYFDKDKIKVMLSDGIVSDAAAGSDYIKLKEGKRFSAKDLRVYEVHEGWVHVGTTLNGKRQPWATWLSVGSPRITASQEGLAVLLETLTFSSFPQRARKISERVQAVSMAEEGADFRQIFEHFVDQGLPREDSYQVTQRVFRGGDPAGGSYFTKDISYVKGIVENINFIRSAILSDVPQVIPLLFVGKVTLDDIPVLYEHLLDGTVVAPRYLPPMFADINGLYVWFGFSSSLGLVDLGRVKRHFEKLFANLRPAGRPGDQHSN